MLFSLALQADGCSVGSQCTLLKGQEVGDAGANVVETAGEMDTQVWRIERLTHIHAHAASSVTMEGLQ